MQDRPETPLIDTMLVEHEQAPMCIHHWVLREPSRGEVAGSCKRCGARKVFPASPESTDRFDDYRELATGGGYYPQRQPA